MTSIGDTLRRERLRRGLDLDKVAAETKIGRHQLEAIEANQFDRLPGGVFARSFIRQYARLLELDDEEIIAELKQQFDEPADTAPVLEPQPSSAPHVAEPASLQPKVSAESAESKSDFRPAEVTANGTIRVPAETARPPEPLSTTKTVGKPEGFPVAMRVAFTASEPVWVSIKSDGARAYIGMIERQESKQFDASRRMTVLVGNAGALQILLNGKRVGPIGPRGEIRLLVLTPQGAHVVPRTPPTPSPTSDVASPSAEGER